MTLGKHRTPVNKVIGRIRARYLIGGAAIAALALGTGGGYALAATLAAKTAPASNIYGCVSGSSRTLEHVYTVAGNYKACPKGSFAVTVASGKTGPAGPKGATGKTGPTGPTGPAGVEAVTVPFNNVSADDPQSLAPGAEGTYIATCSSDQVDFSGGYSLSSPDLQVLQSKPTWYGLSNPTPTTTPASGWEVIVKNTGSTTLTGQLVNDWAVCGTLDSSSTTSS